MLTTDNWLHYMLNPKLIESVPKDIQALFEVARSAMIYGYYFYPLYTLAAEQLYRVTEAAVTHKCKALGLNERKTFKSKVESLGKKSIISKSELKQWDSIRKLRNIASHPTRQPIVTPGNAIGMLDNISEKINLLFSAT